VEGSSRLSQEEPQKVTKKREPPHVAAMMLKQWFVTYGLPEPVTEHRFHPTRKWRFDAAIPSAKVAIEVNGGIWTRGRHMRGSGYIGDRMKINAAQILGWIVLEFATDQIKSGEAALTIAEALATRSPGAAS